MPKIIRKPNCPKCKHPIPIPEEGAGRCLNSACGVEVAWKDAEKTVLVVVVKRTPDSI